MCKRPLTPFLAGKPSILLLPPELLEIILQLHIVAASPHERRKILQTAALVHRSWTPSVRYLAFTAFSFNPKNTAEAYAMLKLLKDRQRGPCRSLYMNTTRMKNTGLPAFGRPQFAELYEVVAPTLWKLEVHSSLGYYRVADEESELTFPVLQELRTWEISNNGILDIIATTMSGRQPAPSALVIHHDFEVDKERHLVKLPVTAFGKGPRRTISLLHPSGITLQRTLPRGEEDRVRDLANFAAEVVTSNRPPLDVYIGRRPNFYDFIESLVTTGVPKDFIARGMCGVNIWLKDGEEMPKELDDLMREMEWRPFVTWNASE